MWERFELFWTAFEKFALFFGFLGSLVALILVVSIYNSVTQMSSALAVSPTPTSPPTPTPQPTPPVGETIDVVLRGFAKIQDSVSTGNVPISHTVPIVIEIHIQPDKTKLEFVGANEVKTNDIAIKFPDDVGWLVGKEALLKFKEGEKVGVKMDVREQVRFSVPIRVDVPIQVPSGVDLSQEIDALHAISESWGSGSPP